MFTSAKIRICGKGPTGLIPTVTVHLVRRSTAVSEWLTGDTGGACRLGLHKLSTRQADGASLTKPHTYLKLSRPTKLRTSERAVSARLEESIP